MGDPQKDELVRMSPLRVLHVDTEPGWRGGQGQVATILSYQDSLGIKNSEFKLALFTLENSELFKRLSLGLKHISFYTAPVSGSFKKFEILRRFVKVLGEFKPDIIHVHSSRDHTLVYLATYLFRLNKTKVFVHRRVDYKPSSSIFSYLKYKTIGIHAYLCVSEYVRKVLIQFGVSESKCITVHSSLDSNKFKNIKTVQEVKKTLTQELNVGSFVKEFWLCPAALTEQKGHTYLLHAFKIFLEKFSIKDVVLVLCGEGDLRSSIEVQIAQSNLTKNVRLLGYRKDIDEIMQASDLVILSSVDEGLGTSLLDAGLLEKAVLATNVGGIPEIITSQQEGVLVPSKNPEAMAEAMYAFYSNPELKAQHGKALQRKVKEKFSSEKMNQRILYLYKNLP